jgi:hypothetical protein
MRATHLPPTIDSPYHPGMERRRFLLTSLAGAVAAPLAVEAQQTSKVYRIGYLDLARASDGKSDLEAFTQRMRDLGYVKDRNISFDHRWAEGNRDRCRVSLPNWLDSN